jgi:hypothetical protein
MPIDLTKLPEHLIEAAKTGSLVPFIGAGVSRQAKTTTSNTLRTWTEFIKELVRLALDDLRCIQPEEAEQIKKIKKLVDRGRYLMAGQALKSAIPEDALDVYIERRFGSKGAKPGHVHRALFKLRTPLILTSNYDLLLEDAYAAEFRQTAKMVTHREPQQVRQVLKSYHQVYDRPLVFKVHGTVGTPKEVVFSEKDYRNLLHSRPGYLAVLSAVFVTKVVLMLGFSFSDPELTMITGSLREWFEDRSSPDYLVLRRGEKVKVEKDRLRGDFGLEVIEYDPSPGDPELLQLVTHLAKLVPAPQWRGRV